MAKNTLSENFTEPLNDATTAKIDIHAGDGNLTIDRSHGSELASGTLQYLEDQDPPTRTSSTTNGEAALNLRGSRAKQPWLHLPWAACNGATEWQVHLNPTISTVLTAHSDGGNVRLNLEEMSIKFVSAETGGGNVEVVLPDNAAYINVNAKTGAGNAVVDIGDHIKGFNEVNASSGAGNVTVLIPRGIAAHIHATSGMGKALIDPVFRKIDNFTYQSTDFESAADKVEIMIRSGAGNLIVNLKD